MVEFSRLASVDKYSIMPGIEDSWDPSLRKQYQDNDLQELHEQFVVVVVVVVVISAMYIQIWFGLLMLKPSLSSQTNNFLVHWKLEADCKSRCYYSLAASPSPPGWSWGGMGFPPPPPPPTPARQGGASGQTDVISTYEVLTKQILLRDSQFDNASECYVL